MCGCYITWLHSLHAWLKWYKLSESRSTMSGTDINIMIEDLFICRASNEEQWLVKYISYHNLQPKQSNRISGTLTMTKGATMCYATLRYCWNQLDSSIIMIWRLRWLLVARHLIYNSFLTYLALTLYLSLSNIQVLPTYSGKVGDGEPLLESLIWLLLTSEVPTKAQVDTLTAELHQRASKLPSHSWLII